EARSAGHLRGDSGRAARRSHGPFEMKSLCSLPVGPEQIERAIDLRRAVGETGGLAVVERFIGTQRGLTRAERDLVLDWADNSVRGIFEVRGGTTGSAIGQ